jgi:hypothetical protein
VTDLHFATRLMRFAEPSPAHPEDVCRCLINEIRALAEKHLAGGMCEATFVSTLLALEAEKAAAHGIELTASNTIDDWTVVILRERGRSEPVAALEFEPSRRAFRPVTVYVGKRAGGGELIR